MRTRVWMVVVMALGIAAVASAGEIQRQPVKVHAEKATRGLTGPDASSGRSAATTAPDLRVQVDLDALHRKVAALERRIEQLERHRHAYQDRRMPGGNTWLRIGQIRGDDERYDDYGYWFISPDQTVPTNRNVTEVTEPPKFD